MIQNKTVELASQGIEKKEKYLKAFTFLPESYSDIPEGLPLSGVPIGVKDIIATKDMPTTFGSKAFMNHWEDNDASIVSHIKSLGGVVFGKTATTEFAWRTSAETRNPWNIEHTPGGSSSGSAAAVGAGILDVALGTQTVGSIIRPAAYCGVVGYKPTFGSIPTDGVHPLAQTLDHLGFIVSDMDWAINCYELFVKNDMSISQRSSRQYKIPRSIGIYRSPFWDKVNREIKDNVDSIVNLLKQQGIQCIDLNFGDEHSEWLELVDIILAYEAYRDISPTVGDRYEDIGNETRELLDKGKGIALSVYEKAISDIKVLRDQRDAYLGGHDAILSICSPTLPPEGITYTGDASLCAPWTMFGLPAIALPSGISADRLPLSVQLIGYGHQDESLLYIGRWLEFLLPNISAPECVTHGF